MKFTNHVKCPDCANKCDIYAALIKKPKKYTNFSSIRLVCKKREIICKQGTKVAHAMYVLKGRAKLYIEGLNRKNIIMNIIRANSYIGLISYFEPVDYCYSVMALEDMEICLIDLDTLKNLYQSDHVLFMKLNQALAHSSSSIMKKIITLNQKNIRGRLAESLIYLSEMNGDDSFHMGITRKELGEMCSISEENTVRLLKDFKTEKVIEVSGRDIRIIDRKMLNKICENG